MSARNRVVYVARDIERALGAEPSPEYLVVANDSEHARSVQARYRDFVLLIKSPVPLDTFDLLEKEETAAFIEKAPKKSGQENQRTGKPAVLVFKSTTRIEELCAKKGWRLLNPPAALAEKIENKITQAEWLAEPDARQNSLAPLLPAFKIIPIKEIAWKKKPLVLQFAHAHTGEGTILVNAEKELEEIQEKFPDRPAKASEYVFGPTFTVNIVVGSRNKQGNGTFESEGIAETVEAEHISDIAIGNPSYQITGMPPLTDNPFTTVGNDWSLPHTILNDRMLVELQSIALSIGAKMRDSGWRGLFGIDVIYDEERDEWKLIEINARQPASTTFESQLQSTFRGHGLVGSTIFETHLAALLDLPLPENIIEINDGAQVVQRVTQKMVKENSVDIKKWQGKIETLNKDGYTTIPYSNIKLNADFLRIQSARGLMESHGKWNGRGMEICDILES